MSIVEHGLNLSRPDVTTPEEMREFRAFYEQAFGSSLAAFEPWAEFRPDVLKRFRMQVHWMAGDGARDRPLARDLAFLQYYLVIGFEEGIRYEIRVAQFHGATRQEILEALAIAFIHAGPYGSRYLYHAAQEHLRAYVDPEPQPEGRWPDGWINDPAALQAGLDYSKPELLPGEIDAIERWYERVCGEVPRYVRFAGRHRPALLKAYRIRFETAIGSGLPKQVLPYLLVHLHVSRSNADGIREAVLLARGLGMSRADALDAISWGSFYGGMSSLSLVDESVGEILDGWR